MQNGFNIAIVAVAIAIVGIGGLVTYAGLKALDSQSKQQVASESKLPSEANMTTVSQSTKEGKLSIYVGSGFAAKLKSCQASTTEFVHMLTNEKMKRIIEGVSEGKCIYIEEMPNNGRMTCRLNETDRKEYATYFEEIAAGNEISTSAEAGTTADTSTSTTVVDGKPLSFDPNTLFTNGSCEISGY